jgi:hypothetical protein
MSNGSNKKKALLLLLTLSLFSMFLVKETKKDNKIEETSGKEYTLIEKPEISPEQIEITQDVLSETDDSNLNPIKQIYSGTVLSGESCQIAEYFYSAEKTCETSLRVEEDMSDAEKSEEGRMIRKDAKIELVEVEVPPQYSGSPTMDTSVKQIKKDIEGNYHWTLKPAGAMISKEAIGRTVIPGENHYENIIEPFAIEYKVQVSGDAQGEGDSELTIDEHHWNDCIEGCENPPDPTVEYASDTAEKFFKIYHAPKDPGGGRDIVNCADSIFKDMDIKGARPLACTPKAKAVVVSFIKWVPELFDPKKCKEEDYNDPNCISTANIIIIMESPWGTREDCVKKGLCVNTNSLLKTEGLREPQAPKDRGYYVLTDCTVSIEGILGLVKVKCAWDIDYMLRELEYQAFDNIPTEEYPTKEEYIDFHVVESENRADQPRKM